MDQVLVFLDCAVKNKADRSLNIEVYKKSMEQSLLTLRDTLQHKLYVVQLLNPRTQMVPSMVEGKEKEKYNIRESLKMCGYPGWAFLKSTKNNKTNKQKTRER